MEDPPRGLAVTSATARFRFSPRLGAVVLAAVIVALTAFIVLSAVLIGTFSAAHLWSAATRDPAGRWWWATSRAT